MCRTVILAINERLIADCRRQQRALRIAPGDHGTMLRGVAGVASSTRATEQKKGVALACDPVVHVVGDTGFEPVTPAV